MVSKVVNSNCTTSQTHPNAIFQAGGVSRQAHMWSQFTQDKWVLDMVRGLSVELESLPSQHEIPDSASLSPEKDIQLNTQIEEMLAQGILEPAFHKDRAFVSHMFLRPKPDGKYRPILNLSYLNEFTVYRHFKMDHLSSVMRMVPQNSYLASIDITQAYHALSVKERDRDLLQLKFHNRYYRFTCLPNGYSPGPRVFTRIMKALMAHLRLLYGVNLVFYIDDTLIYGKTPELVAEYVRHTLRVLQQAGFSINYKKSVLQPSKVIDYLGFTIDSNTLTLTIPPKKVQALCTLGEHALTIRHMSIRKFAGIVGKFAATDPGNCRAKVQIKTLQIAKVKALRRNNFDYEGSMYLDTQTKQCIRMWVVHIPKASAVYAEKPTQATVFTDASKSGWGFFWQQGDFEYGEEWSVDQSELHINILELQAVLLALKSLVKHVRKKHIQLFVDNTTAISCIRKGGSTGSYTCNNVTQDLYRYAWAQHITFVLAYCPTKENVEADRASRAFTSSAEWSLSQDTQLEIFSVFPKPTVDLFASAQNHVCSKYVTLIYDADAIHTDAFSTQWHNKSYLFPPFSLIGRVLRKIQQDKTTGLLLVPRWPTQTWYSAVTRLPNYHRRLEIPITRHTLRWPGKPRKVFPMANQCQLLVIPL